MASLNTFSFLMVLFITIGVVIAANLNDRLIKENNCEAKMDMPCAKEVFNNIFKNGSISNKCCGELLVLGDVCHFALVKRTLENHVFKHVKSETIVKKSFKAWNDCLVLTHSPSPSA